MSCIVTQHNQSRVQNISRENGIVQEEFTPSLLISITLIQRPSSPDKRSYLSYVFLSKFRASPIEVAPQDSE